MKRSDYENNKWYPLTENEYWVEDYPDEFPNCHTVVHNANQYYKSGITTSQFCTLGWSTMAKSGGYFFMIIEEPK
jgi:hypothetical protein